MKRNMITERVAGSLMVLLGVTCGGGNGGAPASVSGYCEQRAVNECATIAGVCAVSDDVCKADRMALCMTEATAQMSTLRPFRPEKVGACVAKAQEVYGKTVIVPADTTALNETCAKVFSGSKKVNEPCGNTYECDQNMNLICDRTVCAAKKPVGATAFCNNPGDTCPMNSYCKPGMGGAVDQCAPSKAAGETCGAGEPCVDTLRCSGTSCMPKVATGLSCVDDTECAPDAPYCNPYFGNTCDQGLRPARGTPVCTDFGGTASGGGTGGASGGGTGGSSGGGGTGP